MPWKACWSIGVVSALSCLYCGMWQVIDQQEVLKHTYKNTYIHIYVCIHTYKYIHTHIYTYTYTHTCMQKYICIHTRMHASTHACIKTYICMHSATHPHTHTRTCLKLSGRCMVYQDLQTVKLIQLNSMCVHVSDDIRHVCVHSSMLACT